MKRWHGVAALLACGAVLTALVLLRAEEAEGSYQQAEKAAAEAPEIVEIAEAPAKPLTVTYTMYFSVKDAEMIAKTVWGEARGCDADGQAKVVWCVLNRVDDERFPDSIQGVVTQPYQFHGYDETYPITEDIYALVYDVLTRWSLEKQGVAVMRELPQSYVYFTGDGWENHFREVY